MFKTMKAAASVALVTAVAAPGAVSAAVTINGGVSSVTVPGSDPGLVLFGSTTGPSSFTLTNVGDSFTTNVLVIGTREGSVELDDLMPRSVTANFSFVSPSGAGGSVGGTSRGTFASLPCILGGGCGRVTWAGPTVFNFGQGGSFSVRLTDATFATPGEATISAEYTLLANAIPEPETWALLILGFGVVGGALRMQRKARAQPTYA